jgi:hypothetical protein
MKKGQEEPDANTSFDTSQTAQAGKSKTINDVKKKTPVRAD